MICIRSIIHEDYRYVAMNLYDIEIYNAAVIFIIIASRNKLSEFPMLVCIKMIDMYARRKIQIIRITLMHATINSQLINHYYDE